MLIKLTHGGLMTEIHAKSILKNQKNKISTFILAILSFRGWLEREALLET